MKSRGRALAAALGLALLLGGCTTAEEQEAARQAAYDAGYAAGAAAGQESGQAAGYAAGQADGFAEGMAAAEKEQRPSAGNPEAAAAGFVEVAEVVPDVLLEMRYYGSFNFVGEPIDGYEAPVALLTREAAEALRGVSDDLQAAGYRLKIYDAYRPARAVEHFKRWAESADERMKPWFYPEKAKDQLLGKGYISRRSGHSRGSTVDLTLFDMAAGRDADMGGSFDFFGERSHAAFTDGLTAAQRENRALLRQTMEAHGFRGISTEWWHYTLRDEPYPETYFDFPVRPLGTEEAPAK